MSKEGERLPEMCILKEILFFYFIFFLSFPILSNLCSLSPYKGHVQSSFWEPSLKIPSQDNKESEFFLEAGLVLGQAHFSLKFSTDLTIKETQLRA